MYLPFTGIWFCWHKKSGGNWRCFWLKCRYCRSYCAQIAQRSLRDSRHMNISTALELLRSAGCEMRFVYLHVPPNSASWLVKSLYLSDSCHLQWSQENRLVTTCASSSVNWCLTFFCRATFERSSRSSPQGLELGLENRFRTFLHDMSLWRDGGG